MINFFSAFVVPAAAQVYEEKTSLRKKLEADLGLDQQEAIDRQLRALVPRRTRCPGATSGTCWTTSRRHARAGRGR